MTLHTLSWGMIVKTKHGDAVQSWPRVARQASSAAMERGKQHLRDKEGEFEFVSQRSSCTEVPADRPSTYGNYQLYLEVVIRMTGKPA